MILSSYKKKVLFHQGKPELSDQQDKLCEMVAEATIETKGQTNPTDEDILYIYGIESRFSLPRRA